MDPNFFRPCPVPPRPRWRGHEEHSVRDLGASELWERHWHCHDCGVSLVTTRDPAEYVRLELELELEPSPEVRGVLASMA